MGLGVIIAAPLSIVLVPLILSLALLSACIPSASRGFRARFSVSTIWLTNYTAARIATDLSPTIGRGFMRISTCVDALISVLAFVPRPRAGTISQPMQPGKVAGFDGVLYGDIETARGVWIRYADCR